ncbi:serine/threonine-protein kinase [Streptomyces racemochromogenes]|uniref:serine/threonine-protein kinase n=1 Tax=Streptomyces racemochromogenes TaxID=67353 RepID=UPI0031E5B534
MISGGFAVRVGEVLADRYRLDRRLGAGGMGEVWRGHDRALHRAVAVKVLLDAATNEELIARFRREATIGARLQHPGITVVHDVGQHEGRLFIVMELLSGEDLGARLARSPGGLPVAEAVELGAQTAEALAAAHERAVVHRDLKPQNLFLLPGGRLKICDFGIAHSADATAGWTVTGRMFGTPPYMAPEQWRGEHVDARCDLYALGCVLYALLSGEPPFGSAEPMYVLMRRHVEDAPLPLAVPGVSAELGRLVLALLAKDPRDRPESAGWVAGALRGLGRIADGGGAGASTPGDGPWGEPGSLAGAGAGPDAEAKAGAETNSGAGPDSRSGAGAGPGAEAGSRSGTGAGPGAEAGSRSGAGVPHGAGRGPGAERGPEPGGGTGSGRGPDGFVPAPVRDFVRELLLEAEETLVSLPPGAGEARTEGLALAAEAAARFDAGLAGRLLADAELWAWTDGDGDGARVAALLTSLARRISRDAPARTERVLTDAQQALFAVSGPKRLTRLRKVAEELAAVAPERGVRLARRYFAGGPAEEAVLARAAPASAAADLPRAEGYLSLIQDPTVRAAAESRAVTAVARQDLPAALRLAARIPGGGARVRALCRVAGERSAVGDRAGAAEALALAERALADTGDGDLEAARADLEAARDLSARDLPSVLDPAVAQERAAAARRLAEPAERGRELAWIARDCTAGAPWLAAVAADPGTPPPRAPGPRPRPRPDAVGPRPTAGWRTDERPDELHAAGERAVWTTGAGVGCVDAPTGATLWTAYADEGVRARPLPEPERVWCAADADTVCVVVTSGAGSQGRLVVRDPADGRVRWWRELDGPAELIPVPGLLLHAAHEELTALDKTAGEPVWRHRLSGVPSFTVSGECLVVGGGGRLRALHLPSGTPLWSWPRGYDAGAPAAPDQAAGGPVHVLDGGVLRALDRRKGYELWRFEPGVPAAGLLVDDGVVYAAAYRAEQGWDVVFALDAESGAVRWQRPVTRREGTACVLELLGVRRGVLYVRSSHGGRRGLLGRTALPFVTGLDVTTGKPRGHRDHPAEGPGPVVAADALVFAGPALTGAPLPS